MKVFGLGLPLRQRRKATRKSPIIHLSVEMRSISTTIHWFYKTKSAWSSFGSQVLFWQNKITFFSFWIFTGLVYSKTIFLQEIGFVEISRNCQEMSTEDRLQLLSHEKQSYLKEISGFKGDALMHCEVLDNLWWYKKYFTPWERYKYTCSQENVFNLLIHHFLTLAWEVATPFSILLASFDHWCFLRLVTHTTCVLHLSPQRVGLEFFEGCMRHGRWVMTTPFSCQENNKYISCQLVFHTTLHYTMNILYYTILYYILYYTLYTIYCTILYYILYYTVLYCTILYITIHNYTILYITVL